MFLKFVIVSYIFEKKVIFASITLTLPIGGKGLISMDLIR